MWVWGLISILSVFNAWPEVYAAVTQEDSLGQWFYIIIYIISDPSNPLTTLWATFGSFPLNHKFHLWSRFRNHLVALTGIITYFFEIPAENKDQKFYRNPLSHQYHLGVPETSSLIDGTIPGFLPLLPADSHCWITSPLEHSN